MSADLKTFVKLLKKEDLFSNHPGREFKAFPEFTFSMKCIQPGRLNLKLEQLNKRLDKSEDVERHELE